MNSMAEPWRRRGISANLYFTIPSGSLLKEPNNGYHISLIHSGSALTESGPRLGGAAVL